MPRIACLCERRTRRGLPAAAPCWNQAAQYYVRHYVGFERIVVIALSSSCCLLLAEHVTITGRYIYRNIEQSAPASGEAANARIKRG